MSEALKISVDQLMVFMDAYADHEVTGSLTRNGMPLEGKVGFMVNTPDNVVTVKDCNNISSGKDGVFKFVLQSEYEYYGKRPHGAPKTEQRTVHCIYCYNGTDTVGVAIQVNVKPSPI